MLSVINNLRLQTRLLLMMLLMSLILILLLFFVYSHAEKALIAEVERYTEELSSAIQVSMEEITKGDEEIKDEKRLKEYVRKFKNKGVRDISILDKDLEVIASSNQASIGQTLNLAGSRMKTSGAMKEYIKTAEGSRNYHLLLPVVVGNEQLGYVHIAIILDDFTELLRINNLRRLMATVMVFAIGITVSMFLSVKYTEPINKLAVAARKVAAGDLTETMEVKGKDEIGELTRSFNEMVKGLRERQELEEKLSRAEHLSRIGHLASGIAHEVRNPLNLINLSIDHIRVNYTPEDEKGRGEFTSILSNIKADIHRLNRMINSFLDYGKPLKLTIIHSSLVDIIEEVLSLAREKLTEQKIDVERVFSQGLPPVPVDGQQIKACLLNIVLNAVQAMPHGGRISIETSFDDRYASVKVQDTGCGIPAEQVHNIFEPYFTTKEAGIGLGLAVTRRIIEKHDGFIDIDSEVGKGTEVIVRLSLKIGEA